MGISVNVGIGDGTGVMTGDSGKDGCDWGMGIRGAIDGPTFTVAASATVIGERVCSVTVVGGGDETSTMRAVLPWLASGDGSDFGGDLSP
ncbi:MAG: hypothetical protein HP496_02300 [Nitrospira sp.]|nr:hypothetical protein [Nitrospira sp.]